MLLLLMVLSLCRQDEGAVLISGREHGVVAVVLRQRVGHPEAQIHLGRILTVAHAAAEGLQKSSGHCLVGSLMAVDENSQIRRLIVIDDLHLRIRTQNKQRNK